VRVGLVGSIGEDMTSDTVLHLKDWKQEFVFNNIPYKPVPSILRGFSAPVKLTTDLSNEDLRFLMVNDADGFNRWEAGQTYALRMIDDLLENPEKEVWPDFIDSYGALLDLANNPVTDKALLTRFLSIPDITVIGQRQEVIDPSAIYIVREKIFAALLAAQLRAGPAVHRRRRVIGARVFVTRDQILFFQKRHVMRPSDRHHARPS
jgi:aminopeptidase N